MRVEDLRIADRTLPSVTQPQPLAKCEAVIVHTTGRGLTQVVADPGAAPSAAAQ